VLLNAGAAIVASGRVGTIPEGIGVAASVIDDGRAAGLLARLRAEQRAAVAARAATELASARGAAKAAGAPAAGQAARA
jgi:hypothetical protein